MMMAWRIRRTTAIAATLVAILAASAATSRTTSQPPPDLPLDQQIDGVRPPTPQTSPTLLLPPANQPFDYQLGGIHPPADEIAIIVRDRLDPPAEGRYNICYVNAFQTQPGDLPWWRANHPDLLLERKGKLVFDPAWPDEVLLDIATAQKREVLMAIVGSWIDGCARDGFDAIETDNLDSWTRSKGGVEQEHAIAYATLLTERAHRAGLAIAQKNASELAEIGKTTIGFDFVVAEECQVWSECEAYIDAYGTHVYDIEYSDTREDGDGRSVDPLDIFKAACAAQGDRIAIIYRDRNLVPAGAPEHVYRAC